MRVQSAEGTKRIEITASSSTSKLFETIYDAFELNSYAFALYKEKNRKGEIASSKTNTIQSQGLKHGDMIYMAPVNGAVLFPSSVSVVVKWYWR